MKSVPDPCPPWQIVHPKLLIGCGPLPSKYSPAGTTLPRGSTVVAPLVKNGCDLKTLGIGLPSAAFSYPTRSMPWWQVWQRSYRGTSLKL